MSPLPQLAPADLAAGQRDLPRALGLLLALSGFVGTSAFFCRFCRLPGNLPRPAHTWMAPSVDVGAAQGAWPYLGNLLLIVLFGLQHSGMARPGFKRILAIYIPPALERAVYVHAACLAGFLLIVAWQPIPIALWEVSYPPLKIALWIGFAAGWLLWQRRSPPT